MQTKFTSPIKANNKGSSSKLVNYLEKENDKNLSGDKEYFFTSDRDKCNKWEVIQQIDNNAKGQKIEKDQDRFFSIVISPSQAELGRRVVALKRTWISKRLRPHSSLSRYCTTCRATGSRLIDTGKTE